MAGSMYFNTLNTVDGERYLKKLTLTDERQLADPFTLCTGWSTDIGKYPHIAWRDVTDYLINTPSVYTKESLRAYKSLEAFTYFTCGHVQECYYHPISNDEDFCFIKSQVLPGSQRQNVSLYEVWVCLNKKHGWILTGNCTCTAGLGSACSHIAALLFKIEAAVHLHHNGPPASIIKLRQWKVCKKSLEPAPLSQIVLQKLKQEVCKKSVEPAPLSQMVFQKRKREVCKKSVEPAPLSQIVFQKRKRGDLQTQLKVSDNFEPSYTCHNPTEGPYAISAERLRDLYRCNPKAVVFTSIDPGIYMDGLSHNTGSETVNDNENDENSIQEQNII